MFLDIQPILSLLPEFLHRPVALLNSSGSAGWAQWSAKLVDLSAEYLFFVGTTYLSILLIKSRRWISSVLMFASGVLWLTFHLPVSLYLQSLGVDSFAETKSLDLEEAEFWFKTMGQAIQPVFSTKKFLVYLAFSVLTFYLLKKVLEKLASSGRAYVLTKLSIALAFMIFSVQVTASKAFALYVQNSELFLTATQNFSNAAPDMRVGKSQTSLMVYIGESTSVMNMGLYGYPRPTTPRLSELRAQDDKLIVFNNVFSTHVHTTGSLLEALSLGMAKEQDFLPINERKRLSIVEVLNESGFETRLLSNQGLDGSWSQASLVIFKNSVNVFRVGRKARDRSAASPQPQWDDQFFDAQIKALDLDSGEKRRAVFLHSYAGHGRYEANIPEPFRKPVDNTFALLRPSQILLDPTQSLDLVETYDSAIRYVDHSVSSTIAHVQKAAKPIIFVYFADHGDAAFGGMGHDSARFRHEMARVPLLIYFNEAAKRDNPGLHEKYQRLAQRQEVSTLAQLSSTLMDLARVDFINPLDNAVMLQPVLGQKVPLPPILVRATIEGTTFINLNPYALEPPPAKGRLYIDKTDPVTTTFVALRGNRQAQDEVCRSAQETFESLSRSILISGCNPTEQALKWLIKPGLAVPVRTPP